MHRRLTPSTIPVYSLISGALLFACASQASVITTATGSGADATVRSGTHANSNFGNATVASVKNDSTPNATDFNRKTYLRFDLSTITELPSATSASLKLTLNNGGDNFSYNVFGLIDGTTGEVFTEGAGETGVSGATPPNPITWNNAPANDTTAGGGTYDTGTSTGGGVNNALTVFLGTFSTSGVAAGSSINFSTPELVSFLNADTNDFATLIITRSGNANTATVVDFRSKENAAGSASYPTLTVLIPEPATASVLLLNMMGGLMRRRRRLDRKPEGI